MTLDATVANADRLHSLDSLRATMMLLGIVLHTVVSYVPIKLGEAWMYQDESQTMWAMVAFLFIHAFRMQVFFVIAGFFTALLLERRGTGGVIKNRLERIAVPFVIGLFLLWPMIVAGFIYATYGAGALSQVPTSVFLVPTNTGHLWFLEYLLFFYVGALILSLESRFVPEGIREYCSSAFTWLLGRPVLRVILLGLVSSVLLVPVGGRLPPSTEFLPAFHNLVFYFVYFAFGWFLYHQRQMLKTFVTGAWTQTIAATVIYLGFTFILKPQIEESFAQIVELTSLIAGLTEWMFVFGITGLFIRYFDKPSARTRYIVDASYWVYLLHLPVVITVTGMFANTGLSAWVKMPIVMLITTVICFATYDVLVRNSFIGRVLNGRRYPRGLPKPEPTPG